MQTVTTIGLDIVKSVFQVHGVDAEGKPDQIADSDLALRRKPKRVASTTENQEGPCRTTL